MGILKQPPSPSLERSTQAEHGGTWRGLWQDAGRRCPGMKKVSSVEESRTEEGEKLKSIQDRSPSVCNSYTASPWHLWLWLQTICFTERFSIWVCLTFPPDDVYVVHLYQGYRRSDTVFSLEPVSDGTDFQFTLLLMLFILFTWIRWCLARFFIVKLLLSLCNSLLFCVEILVLIKISIYSYFYLHQFGFMVSCFIQCYNIIII